MARIPGIRPRVDVPFMCVRDGVWESTNLHVFDLTGATEEGGFREQKCRYCGCITYRDVKPVFTPVRP